MSHSTEKTIHQGRNVKRFREMRGLKQEGLALELGDDWTQRKISLLEAREEIEPEILKQVANALKMPVEVFTDLDEDGAFNIISNTFHNNSHDSSSLIASAMNYQPTFNAIDKVVQLYDEKIELYERMLKEKSEMIEKLERLLSQKK